MAHAEPAVLARAEGKQRAWRQRVAAWRRRTLEIEGCSLGNGGTWRQRVAAWEMEDPGDRGLQLETEGCSLKKKAAAWET